MLKDGLREGRRNDREKWEVDGGQTEETVLIWNFTPTDGTGNGGFRR